MRGVSTVFGRNIQGKNGQGTNGHHFNTFNIPEMIRSIEKIAKYSVAIFSLAIDTYNRAYALLTYVNFEICI